MAEVLDFWHAGAQALREALKAKEAITWLSAETQRLYDQVITLVRNTSGELNFHREELVMAHEELLASEHERVFKVQGSKVQSHLYVALDQGYLDQQKFTVLYDLSVNVKKLISGFMRSLRSQSRTSTVEH